jgi:hypothetical protein
METLGNVKNKKYVMFKYMCVWEISLLENLDSKL